MIKEKDLIENKGVRESFITRVEMLDRIKELNTLADTDYMTTRQVAEFYEVGVEAIDSIARRHNEELTSDGYELKRKSEIIEILNIQPKYTINVLGKSIVESPNLTFHIPNRGLRLFTKRAALRIGMMLTSSEVAQEIRVQLLKENPVLYNEMRQGQYIYHKKYEEDAYALLKSVFGTEKIKREVFYKGYYIDFVLFDNIAVEIDEDGHRGYEQKQEKIRESAISSKYRLFRHDTRNNNYFTLLSDIFDYINNIKK